jgi:hypothetical protein
MPQGDPVQQVLAAVHTCPELHTLVPQTTLPVTAHCPFGAQNWPGLQKVPPQGTDPAGAHTLLMQVLGLVQQEPPHRVAPAGQQMPAPAADKRQERCENIQVDGSGMNAQPCQTTCGQYCFAQMVSTRVDTALPSQQYMDGCRPHLHMSGQVHT